MPASKKVSKYSSDLLMLYTRLAEMDATFDSRANEPLVLPFPTAKAAIAFRHTMNNFGYAMREDLSFLSRSDAQSLIRAHDRREIILQTEPSPHLIVRLRSQNPMNLAASAAMEEFFSRTRAAEISPGTSGASQADSNIPLSPLTDVSLTVESINSMDRDELGRHFDPFLFTPYGRPKDELEAAAKERFAALSPGQGV